MREAQRICAARRMVEADDQRIRAERASSERELESRLFDRADALASREVKEFSITQRRAEEIEALRFLGVKERGLCSLTPAQRKCALRRVDRSGMRAQFRVRYRARLKDGCSPGVSSAEWERLLAMHDYSCAYCGSAENITRDHMTPIARGGRDEPDNVVPACRSCNSQKGARTVDEYIDWLSRIRAQGRAA
jgi:5-methylcytosine-specific restriction endonuclease McrA